MLVIIKGVMSNREQAAAVIQSAWETNNQHINNQSDEVRKC